MVKFFIISLFSLLVFPEGRTQSSLQEERGDILHIPNYQWDYNNLLPDTATLFMQNGHLADSIKKTIFSSREDSNRVWKYLIQAQEMAFANPDSGTFYAQKGLQLAKKIRFEPGEFYCTQTIGWSNYASGNYVAAIPIYFDLLKQARTTNNIYRVAWQLRNIAVIYLSIGDYASSIFYYRKAIETLKPYAGAYPLSMMAFLCNMGSAYDFINQLDTALLLQEKAYEIDTLIHNFWSFPVHEIAGIYAEKGQYEKALKLYRKAFSWAKYSKLPGDTTAAFTGMSDVYEKTHRYDSSFYYANRALVSAKYYPWARLVTYSILTTLFKAKHDMDSAFKYQELEIKIRDDLAGQEKLKQIESIVFNVQLQQQELAAAQAGYKNKIRTYILLGTVAIFVLIAFILWRNNQHITLKRKNEKLEAERAKAELQQQKTELEMQALRAQMNPHFIFNCLNSINSYIANNDSGLASSYLTKFAKLIRMVLQNSGQSFISLEDELQCLRLYMDLEALRFEYPFQYEITCDDKINVEQVKIPPMLIQPFVENAIWHGLHPKKNGTGRICIDIHLENNMLHCRIIDNGVGRKQSVIQPIQSLKEKKSIGIKLTAGRLELMHETEGNDVFIEIKDLCENNDKSTGTSVSLKIPVELLETD